jgi:hypothetical protein
MGLGQGMRIWVAVFALLALGAGAARAQDCAVKQYDSLPMEVSPERLLLPVTFGTAPKQMVFRLDNAANTIAADAADELGMHFTSMPPHLIFHDNLGREVTRIAHASEVHLGRQTLNGLDFLVYPPLGHPASVIGNIGTHMFSNADIELDIAGGKLNLFSPDHCPGKTVYWTKTGFAQVPLKPTDEMGFVRAEMLLDDRLVTVSLSTVGTSRIGMNAMRRVFNLDENSPDLIQVGQDLMGRKIYRYPFKTLTADGLTVNNPAITVFEEEPRPECKDKLHLQFPEPTVHSTEQPRLARCFGGDDVVLGLSVLSKLHLYISGKEKILYLTSAEAK